MLEVTRCTGNPLLSSKDVKPGREGFQVEGVFNCGVARYRDEVILLCRVAESVKGGAAGEVLVPMVKKVEGRDEIVVIQIKKAEHPELDFTDSRAVNRMTRHGEKTVYLTSLSHLRVARSKDGVHFTIEDAPFIFPNSQEESWGMEDPRITQIGKTYYINYTSVTENGAATSLISTEDFRKYKRHGIIFAPENKDVTIFPEKINGRYMAFNRPVPGKIGNPQMWLAQSPDLIHWGHQKHFCGISDSDSWDNARIGGGAVPFKTEKGWLKIYHAADKNDRYCLGAFLLDVNDPSRVIGKTRCPILEPEAVYEKEGFFGNVVFTCGCLVENGMVSVYYGAADDKICKADFSVAALLAEMESV